MSIFEKVTFRWASLVYCSPTLSYSSEMKQQQSYKCEALLREFWKISLRVPSTDHLFPVMCVLSTLSLILKALWRCVCVSSQGPASGNFALIFLLADKLSSFLFQMFSTVACCLHLLDSKIIQTHYLCARVVFFKPVCHREVMIITRFPFRQ